MRTSLPRSPLVLAVLASGCAATSAEPTSSGEPALGSATSAVEASYGGSGTFAIDNSPAANNTILASTGYLSVPVLTTAGKPWVGNDGTPLRSTCGATFISTHYAITAAHCVDSADVPNPATTMLTIDQLDVSAVPLATIGASEASTNSIFAGFPSYTFAQLTAAQGYKVTQYNQCHVVQRCAYGNYDCVESGDEALLRCDDRPWGSSFVPVAPSDPQTGPVGMEWFHEVYTAMPISAPTPPGRFSSGLIWSLYDAALGRYDGYTLYPPIDPSAPSGADQYLWNQNFHYYGGGRNQLLPLTATNYQEGDIYWNPTRLGYDAAYGVVWTDFWGCHGTSGSGVFQEVTTDGLSYTPQFVGAIVDGSTTSGLGTYLCDTNGGLSGRATPHLGYVPLAVSQYLASTAASDWYHLPFPIHVEAATAAPFPLVISHAYAGPAAQAFTLGK